MNEVVKGILESKVNAIRSMNKSIGQKFTIDTSYPCDNGWTFINIKDVNDVNLSRISYKFRNGEIMGYCLKSYKDLHKYSVDNRIFYAISYYLERNKILLNLNEIILKARELQEEVYAERVEFCENNPKFKKNKEGVKVQVKRRCQRKNLGGIIFDLLWNSDIVKSKSFISDKRKDAISSFVHTLRFEN